MPQQAVQIRIIGQENIVRKLERVPFGARQLMEKAAKYGQERMKDYAKPHACDTGALAEAVAIEVEAGPVPLQARIGFLGRGHGMRSSLGALAPTVNYGRRPGRRPSIQAMRRFLRRHGSSLDPRKVAEQIGQRGTRGVLFLEKAERDLRAKLPEIVRETAREIEAMWERAA